MSTLYQNYTYLIFRYENDNMKLIIWNCPKNMKKINRLSWKEFHMNFNDYWKLLLRGSTIFALQQFEL